MTITAAQLMVRVGAETSGAEAGLQSFDSKLKGAAKGAGVAGAALSAGITAPLTAIAVGALRSAAEFEQNMNVLQQVAGATDTQMASLTAQGLELGRVTSFSAGEAAAGMLELAKAGLTATQAGDAIAGVLALAAAGGLNVASAAEIAANAMNAFGLAASDTGMVADLLAAAANASSVEVDDLAMSFRMAASVFASSGQSIQDLTTGLALMGNAGLKGSDAGTSLKQMMLSLTAPTAKAAGLMEELGIAVFDAQGAMLPFRDILGSLEGAMANMTDQQRSAALATIFGSDAVRAANILLAAGTTGWDEMAAAVSKAGVAQDMAAARMSGLTGALEYLRGSVDSVLIAVGLPFLQMLGDWARGIADAASSFSSLSPAVQGMILAFLGVVAVAGPVLLGIAGIAAGIAALANPIGATILVVSALAAAFAGNFLGIRTAVMDAVEAVRPGFEQLLSWISSASQGDWGPLKGGLQGALQSVQIAVQNFSWADFIVKLEDWGTYVAGLTTWDEWITALTWADVVTTMADWGGWISSLDWGVFVPNISDWGAWITALDWTAIVTTMADWGTWIVLLPWNMFVKAVDIGTYILTLPWGDYVTALADWAEFIPGMVWSTYVAVMDWASYIVALPWGDYVTAIVDWSTWINAIIWSEFVDNVTWPVIIQEFSWSTFVSNLTWPGALSRFEWSDFVPSIEWPEGVFSFAWGDFVSNLIWPSATQSFSWSTFVPDLSWPLDKIRSFDWSWFIPKITWPGGLGGSTAERNASGTPFFGGGLTWVGERGPELVALPRASRIWNANDSLAMASGGGGGNVTIYATVSNDIDLERLAYRVRQEMRRA